ncbi:hypothetical protein [Streptomyces orinoci]|uniref:Uncharacterized protein n=1 Tax=Streptomyces orinoci TaxID=67339 RepID=A0ABV3K4Q8_STRON|nr:hypothetical protein [Streptomyces orinoci]
MGRHAQEKSGRALLTRAGLEWLLRLTTAVAAAVAGAVAKWWLEVRHTL